MVNPSHFDNKIYVGYVTGLRSHLSFFSAVCGCISYTSGLPLFISEYINALRRLIIQVLKFKLDGPCHCVLKNSKNVVTQIPIPKTTKPAIGHYTDPFRLLHIYRYLISSFFSFQANVFKRSCYVNTT
jgi:hypothetical protein